MAVLQGKLGDVQALFRVSKAYPLSSVLQSASLQLYIMILLDFKIYSGGTVSPVREEPWGSKIRLTGPAKYKLFSLLSWSLGWKSIQGI